MPRPTKQDVAISAFLGGRLSPSQLNRLPTSEGLGLPPGAAWADYGPALAPLVGTGRDLDVAAIRLAAEHGYMPDRLRQVWDADRLGNGRTEVILEALVQVAGRAALNVVKSGTLPDEAGGLHETVAIRREYQARGEEVPEIYEKLEDTAQVITDRAFADISDTWEGDRTAGFEDTALVVGQVAVDLGGPPEPGLRAIQAASLANLNRALVGRLQSAPQWAKEAPANELVTCVQLAATLWRSTVAHKLPLGEEDAWRMIAALAPCMSAPVALAHEVQSQITTGHAVPLAGHPLEA